MESRQIIWPTERLMANPRVFMAIADFFGEGPDWQTFADAFYELLEAQFEDPAVEPEFVIPECAFREKPGEPEIFQVILTTGDAIELRPDEDSYSSVRTEEELAIVSAIYGRLVKAIESARPDLAGDISLVDVPTRGNDFLRDADGDAFRGSFSLLSNPEQKFDFVVEIVDLDEDDLKATVLPKAV